MQGLCPAYVLALLPAPGIAQPREGLRDIPAQGFVPDEVVTMVVAEAIVAGVYGRAQIARQKPFVASLEHGVWTVSGTMPERLKGGVFVIRIRQRDSQAISLTHVK